MFIIVVKMVMVSFMLLTFSRTDKRLQKLSKLWDTNIGDLLSDTYTLSLIIPRLNSQCVGVAKEVINVRVP